MATRKPITTIHSPNEPAPANYTAGSVSKMLPFFAIKGKSKTCLIAKSNSGSSDIEIKFINLSMASGSDYHMTQSSMKYLVESLNSGKYVPVDVEMTLTHIQ